MANEYRTEILVDEKIACIIQRYPFDGGIQETIEYVIEARYRVERQHLLDQSIKDD